MIDRVELSGKLLAKLAFWGVAVDEVLRRAELSLGSGEDPSVPTEAAFRFWRTLDEGNADPSLGLRIGQEMRSEQYDLLSVVAYSAPTFRQALDKMARYKRLRGAEDVRVIESGGLVRVEMDWVFGPGPSPYLLVDAALAAFVEVGVRGTGQHLRPDHVELRRPDEGLLAHERHFGCPVRYGQPHDAVVFPGWQTRLPLVTRNPVLLGLVEPQLEADLAERGGTRWTDRVRVLLKRDLDGRQSLSEVASRLHQSSRTLQRRLAAEGARFQDLLAEVRQELARGYLSQSDLTVAQIAYLVGFDEPHSFQRAFRSREGVSPGQWRRAAN